ncbi:hypothetical protein HO173_003240 [Letharia columbiana]|uniref:Uncharacterized protein n=1 Tax=Letharia columbiana TaxID=112416 RepID=A0A8H6G1E1_9LECA|nr:uncharacterized protein HO173_003240 [Letharia columbiana]KAF6238734.1 hypothetical protein HO173_003240 [Letharia columbiana]
MTLLGGDNALEDDLQRPGMSTNGKRMAVPIYREFVRTGDIEEYNAPGPSSALRPAIKTTDDHKERIVSSRNLAATCKQIRDEMAHYRSFTASQSYRNSQIISTVFNSLDVMTAYIKTRSPHSLRQPHYIQVKYSGKATAESWKVAQTINIQTLNIVLGPDSRSLIQTNDKSTFMDLQGAQSLFRLRGIPKATMTLQLSSNGCRIFKKSFTDLEVFKRRLNDLSRPFSQSQISMCQRAHYPIGSRMMTRSRCKRLGIEI